MFKGTSKGTPAGDMLHLGFYGPRSMNWWIGIRAGETEHLLRL